MKFFLFLLVLSSSFLFQTPSCRQQEDAPVVKWKGNNDRNDLVFLFRKGITYEQKEAFQNTILYKPRADGRGQDHQDGVVDTMVGTIKDDYEGGIVNFSQDATLEQRERLKKAIEASPIVYKVYENVVPSQIKDLK